MGSLQQSNKNDNNSPYHIYYSLDAINNETTGNNRPQFFSITETRNSPYLSYPNDYFMSVVRFSLQTPSLPVFIPAILLGQIDVDETAYSITMEYNGFEFKKHIKYVPADLTQPIPNPPLTSQDLTSKYYYVYSYQQWVRMVNTAFTDCFAGLLALTPLPTANPPFMEFNIDSQLAIINADELGYNQALPIPIKIFFNTALYTLYNSFQFNRLGYGNTTNGKNFQLDVYNSNGLNVINLPTYNALQMYQESLTTGLLNPVQSIVFTTGLFPIVPENVSIPKIWNSDTSFKNNGNNANISPVITDFQVPWSAVNQYRQTIEYQPAGEYRLVDLYGTSPLQAIEISVFWKDIYANLHPFELESGCSSSIKIMFRRKDYNNVPAM